MKKAIANWTFVTPKWMKGNIAYAPWKAIKAGEAIISCFKMAQIKVVVHPSEDKIDAKFKND